VKLSGPQFLSIDILDSSFFASAQMSVAAADAKMCGLLFTLGIRCVIGTYRVFTGNGIGVCGYIGFRAAPSLKVCNCVQRRSQSRSVICLK
jgi:hypothetical protein